MNWGKGIIGGMILFMLFIIGMSIKMFSIPDDDFDKQYYEKGLNFDKDQVRQQQVTKDMAKPTITLSNNKMIINFAAPAMGSIKFIRPADKGLDKQFAIETKLSKEYSLPLKGIETGQWQLMLEWESAGKSYLYLQEVFINER